ncbi:MAG: hypothetical protein QNJ04_09710 [Desulfobacterales bacterium]|nr:hypothetical protein [Desulfobacterales bacterium]
MPGTGDIAQLVFKRAVKVNSGASLDARALKTLLALDGKMSLGEVARQLDLDMIAIGPIMQRLADNQLIVRVETTRTSVPDAFMTQLKSELGKAIGPIAAALLDDVLEDMQITPHRITAKSAPDIVNNLSREIPDPERRLTFIRQMLATLQA